MVKGEQQIAFMEQPNSSYSIDRMSKMHRDILNYFRSIFPEGATDAEMTAHFGSTKTSYRARRRELYGIGLIQDTGHYKTVGRSRQVVWAAAPWQQEQNQGEH